MDAGKDQLFGYVRDAIATVVSVETAERYLGPFLLTGEEAANCARQAGFENVSLERVTLPAVLPGGAQDLFDTWPASGIASTIEALDDAQRAPSYWQKLCASPRTSPRRHQPARLTQRINPRQNVPRPFGYGHHGLGGSWPSWSSGSPAHRSGIVARLDVDGVVNDEAPGSACMTIADCRG